MAAQVGPVARRAAAALLSHPPVGSLLRPTLRGVLPIFVLHRVVPTELVTDRDVARVAATLDRLRRGGHTFVSLADVVASWSGGPPLPARAVAFTADDGYADQAEVLAPVFEARECPLTIFLVSGFLDRSWVPWWDVLEHAVAATAEDALDVTFGAERLVRPLRSVDERRDAAYDLADAYKRQPADVAEAAVDGVCRALGVERPAAPFGPYQPMTWDDARRLERGGLVRFGPHTVTHPVLARADDGRVDLEIGESRRRLAAELREPLPVFCYPVGEDGDYGPREERAVEAEGLAAAVTVGRRHARVAAAGPSRAERFRLDRIPLRDDPTSAVFAATGVTRVRELVRSRRG